MGKRSKVLNRGDLCSIYTNLMTKDYIRRVQQYFSAKIHFWDPLGECLG